MMTVDAASTHAKVQTIYDWWKGHYTCEGALFNPARTQMT